MNNPKIIKRRVLRRYRKLGLIAGLLFASWVGYHLGYTENRHLSQTLHDAKQTIGTLNNANNTLTAKLNQQEAKHAVCASELDEVNKKRQISLRDIAECREEISLFQHVMAPELSGDLLSVEVTAITSKQADSHTYLVDIILLQPRLQKAVISGDLHIALKYPHTKEGVIISTLPYRFKFFQQATIELEVEQNRSPEKLVFSSDVYQYKRKRESFSAELEWRRTEDRLRWHENN